MVMVFVWVADAVTAWSHLRRLGHYGAKSQLIRQMRDGYASTKKMETAFAVSIPLSNDLPRGRTMALAGIRFLTGVAWNAWRWARASGSSRCSRLVALAEISSGR